MLACMGLSFACSGQAQHQATALGGTSGEAATTQGGSGGRNPENTGGTARDDRSGGKSGSAGSTVLGGVETGGGGDTGGRAPGAAGETIYNETGGSGGTTGHESPIRIVGVKRQGDSSIVVEFATATPIYQRTCTGQMALTKSDGKAFTNELPACGSIPYYLDGAFNANEWYLGCLGCDVQYCNPFPKKWSTGTNEIVRVQVAATGGEGGVSGAAGGAGSSGEAGGAAGQADVPVDALHFETRTTEGPYWLTARYFTSPTCDGPQLTTELLLIDVR
ncbi:MAG TPA: hypothetical protein VFQ61_09110 [Polyangiaceae bacterium]|nr:hypothetical protein [Polyangiaceae bacterium]